MNNIYHKIITGGFALVLAGAVAFTAAPMDAQASAALGISYEAVQTAAKLVGLHGTIVSLDDGYDTLCKPEIFSQGQWQLLSIARAVAGKPGILLLDEITANLDAETEEVVLRALKSASEGRTVISISHRVYQKDGTGRLITVYG